ncbi:sushi domain-containing protein 1 isoform X3 [Cheilinus undulatus]|uniref:sushi domain-containing protein 1 isoform X3 n=1 Tax=Cheilinus undulatus TaxID=241271 RepID=UPI001BD42341|nr:sushi domain-containing protein 1 isoform X3 [Cheilinus undulatus]
MMDETQRGMITVILLCVTSAMLAGGQPIDVCGSCHANATCDDYPDGSGKVCNCKYGFVGNGRTICLDKDECQIGAQKICGHHTNCHNTYGSYFCTCLSGYHPSNNMDVFIPNDGTHCQDTDECMITGLCGDGGLCRNLEGSFECSCQLGYQVHNGPEPFNPHKHKSFCKDKDECQIGAQKICGRHTNCHNTYGSYFCTCLSGYHPSNNMDVFIPNDGTHCQDTDECMITGLCGDGGLCRNLEGSFECSCQLGYQVHNGPEPFNPHKHKSFCKVVDCGRPAAIEGMVLVSVPQTTYSSVAMFACDEGFVWKRGENSSVCGADGQWRRPTAVCEDISCGPPLNLPHTNLLWNGTSTPGSVVLYECMDGFYQKSGNNVSTCSTSGEWEDVSIKCEALCGPAPFLANSEVVWHNRSVVIYRCVNGYHSWRGSNVSVCSSSGVWEKASMKCVEIKPAVNHLLVINEKCVNWRAEKYEEDTEVYKVTYVGSRDYQRSFHDKRKQFVRSKADQLELCLKLLPVTNYSISITAMSAKFTASITTTTSLTVPPAPVIYYREFETPVPTLRLQRSHHTLDPLSLYQVFVVSVDQIMRFDCSSPASLHPSSRTKPLLEYITAQIEVRHVGTEFNFTVGNGLHYGGFLNAQLENGRNYYILLRAVSEWKMEIKSTCVLWAKVKGTSYVLMVSFSAAAALIVTIALIILGVYGFVWCFRKT